MRGKKKGLNKWSKQRLSRYRLPVSWIHQLWSQTQFLQCLVADHHDDGGGCGWNDACGQSFGQTPETLLFDQLTERLDDRGPPFHLNTYMFHYYLEPQAHITCERGGWVICWVESNITLVMFSNVWFLFSMGETGS